MSRLLGMARSLRLDQVLRRARVPRGKLPVLIGVGLALLGVGLVSATVGAGG